MTLTAPPHLTGTPVLETERLRLRAPVAADLAPFADYYASPRSRFTSGPGDAAAAFRVFAMICGHWVLRGYGLFSITLRDGGQPIGLAGLLSPPSWPEGEIAWNLWSDAAEGKGYAFEAATAVRGYAFDRLGWDTAVSYIAPDNLRSAALARRLGAAEDAAARYPGDDPCLVFRHPAPGAAA
ncbi:GNAT family N-acetyltransferase [Szabonella alba]|uniref:GNAT family N-acetyltransferase n=1 Tax=Szabonella alba TaxID=2804194 RepID=A0A8K0Y2Q6_9RHOB|nr:GNAT family N-acetyltransferase [Szabonella alba]MBL4918739.1 GNAT family N-acetyltransferase [Szabonella alba]